MKNVCNNSILFNKTHNKKPIVIKKQQFVYNFPRFIIVNINKAFTIYMDVLSDLTAILKNNFVEWQR